MVKAGYSPITADHEAGGFWRNPKIKAALKERQRIVMAKAEIKAADLIKTLMRIANLDLGDLVGADGKLLPLAELGEDARKALSLTGMRGDMKISTADRLKAIEMVAKLSGLYEERISITGDTELAAALMAARRRTKADD